MLGLAQKSYKCITRNIYVSLYPDQKIKNQLKTLRGPTAKMGSEWKRSLVKNESFNMGKLKQEHTEIKTFLMF